MQTPFYDRLGWAEMLIEPERKLAIAIQKIPRENEDGNEVVQEVKDIYSRLNALIENLQNQNFEGSYRTE